MNTAVKSYITEDRKNKKTSTLFKDRQFLIEYELNIIYSQCQKRNLESEKIILEGSWGLILLLDHTLVDLQFCRA